MSGGGGGGTTTGGTKKMGKNPRREPNCKEEEELMRRKTYRGLEEQKFADKKPKKKTMERLVSSVLVCSVFGRGMRVYLYWWSSEKFGKSINGVLKRIGTH